MDTDNDYRLMGPVSHDAWSGPVDESGGYANRLNTTLIHITGFRSNASQFESTGDQGSAVLLQKLETIFTQLLSSSVPALTNRISGISSIKLITPEPQLGQKPLVTWEPSAPVTV